MSIKIGSVIFLPIIWILLSSNFIPFNNNIVGIVQAENSGEVLAYVRLSVGKNKIGTLSNEEGKFILKIPSYLVNDTLRVSHLGFKPKMIPLADVSADSLFISLKEQALTLEEIDILSLTPEDTVRKCWKTRNANYETRPTLIQGFYQEEMGDLFSGSRFLFAEGVLELYKAPYDKKISDQVRVIKGRQKLTPRVYTYQGQKYKLPSITQGPHLGILLDVMKDKSSFLNRKNQKYYKYIFEKVQYHNDRLTYIFSFYPKKSKDLNALFFGKIFIDLESLAVVRASYSVTSTGKKLYNSLNNKLELSSREYEVNYMEHNGRWYLQDARVKNKYNYPPIGVKLYSYHTFITTEIINEKVNEFPLDQALYLDETFIEIVNSLKEEYWGDYNVIPIIERQ